MVLKFGHFEIILQKYLGSFEMWCWRRRKDISWTQRMKNEDVLQRNK